MRSRKHPSHSPRIARPSRAVVRRTVRDAAPDEARHAAPQDARGLRGSIAQGWRNVLALFLADARHIMSNVIAAIVTVGLVIIPATYAWFTTLGFWDPYANTGELSVAVANNDEGYRSDLLPMTINAGNEVVSALRANDQFHWEFLNEDEALEGVRSGRCYAALVIPKDFSADLMTVFSPDVKRPQIDYYSNEKENAIAPRVTATGASTLQEQIDEAFTRTVADIALDSTSNLTDFMNGEGIANYGTALLNRLNSTVDEMSAASEQVALMAQLVGSTSELLAATGDILGRAGSSADALRPLLDDSESGLADAEGALAGIQGLVDTAIAQADAAYDSLSTAVDAAFATLKNDPAEASALIGELWVSAQEARTDAEALAATPGLSADARQALSQMATALGDVETALGRAQASVDSSAAEAEAAYQRVKDAIAAAKTSLDALHGSFSTELGSATEAFGAQLGTVKDAALTITGGLDEVASGLSTTSSSLAGSLEQVRCGLNDTAAVLSTASADLTDTRDRLRAALDTHDLDTVRAIIGDDPAAIASFIAAPTKLERHAVYAMANNGSSMSPFYTSLSLWIGAIFLVALTSVVPSARTLARLHDPKPWQIYLGRYGIFAAVALCQALLVCLGNVFFLGVQCEHFWLYLLTGVVAALVFSNAVYTLTVSFGNVGKALAIVLLVMQLGGSGGLFPIQMSAPIFQAIYPWLPFAHSMEAFQSCMAGIYSSQYLVSILLLLAFLIPSLILGLALRTPVIRLVTYINTELDKTEVI